MLNAARAFFIDVDLPEPRRPNPITAWVRRLFRRPTAPPDPAAAALARLNHWLDGRPEWGVRLYLTRRGLRYLVTHAPFEPGSPETEGAMTALGCDPYCTLLCRVQKCFRARLTPKPWRCGVAALSVRFPRVSGDEDRGTSSMAGRVRGGRRRVGHLLLPRHRRPRRRTFGPRLGGRSPRPAHRRRHRAPPGLIARSCRGRDLSHLAPRSLPTFRGCAVAMPRG